MQRAAATITFLLVPVSVVMILAASQILTTVGISLLVVSLFYPIILSDYLVMRPDIDDADRMRQTETTQMQSIAESQTPPTPSTSSPLEFNENHDVPSISLLPNDIGDANERLIVHLIASAIQKGPAGLTAASRQARVKLSPRERKDIRRAAVLFRDLPPEVFLFVQKLFPESATRNGVHEHIALNLLTNLQLIEGSEKPLEEAAKVAAKEALRFLRHLDSA